MSLFQVTPLSTGNNKSQESLEIDLMNLITQGDEQAFELLYSRFYSRLFRFISRIARRQELVEEIINDTMYVVWEKASTYNSQCRLSTWIFGIALNRARQSLRNAVQHEHVMLDDMEDGEWNQEFHDPGPLQIETDNWLEFAFEALSVEQRAVMELTYYHGLHYSEIAELMGCSENTIKTRMHYGRKKLAAIFKR